MYELIWGTWIHPLLLLFWDAPIENEYIKMLQIDQHHHCVYVCVCMCVCVCLCMIGWECRKNHYEIITFKDYIYLVSQRHKHNSCCSYNKAMLFSLIFKMTIWSYIHKSIYNYVIVYLLKLSYPIHYIIKICFQLYLNMVYNYILYYWRTFTFTLTSAKCSLLIYGVIMYYDIKLYTIVI